MTFRLADHFQIRVLGSSSPFKKLPLQTQLSIFFKKRKHSLAIAIPTLVLQQTAFGGQFLLANNTQLGGSTMLGEGMVLEKLYCGGNDSYLLTEIRSRNERFTSSLDLHKLDGSFRKWKHGSG